MQLFSADATNFSKKFKLFFARKKLKKRAAHLAQTEEFMFQNMAYRPTVCKTGAKAIGPVLVRF